MGDVLLWSLVASVVLTVVANVAIRLWKPDLSRLFPLDPGPPADPGPPPRQDVQADGTVEPVRDRDRPRVQVFFPWKAMPALSIGLTVVLNFVTWLTR